MKHTSKGAKPNKVMISENMEASTQNEQLGEAPIKGYDEINPEHKAFEDIDEIQSTDDV